MSALDAIRAMDRMPRRSETIYLEMREREGTLAMLRQMVGSFAALDFGPILIMDGVVQRRELKIPDALRDLLRDELEGMARCHHELVQARAREKHWTPEDIS